MSIENELFKNRVEYKYITSPILLDKLLNHFQADPNFDFQSKTYYDNCPYTFSQSLYFDSPFLQSYTTAMDKESSRFKARIRSYSSPGAKSKFFFEVKKKVNGVTSKSRIRIRKKWLKAFEDQDSIPFNEILEYNLDKFSKLDIVNTIEEMRYILHSLNYVPTLRVSYKRHAYRIVCPFVCRLTVDSDLAFERIANKNLPLDPYLNTIGANDVILEVKAKDSGVLESFSNFADSTIGIRAGFSKYCYGIYSTAETRINVTHSNNVVDISQQIRAS